jgi:nitroreductase
VGKCTSDVADSPGLRPWLVDRADFPQGGSREEQLEFCLRYATLAPSSHNAQPWWFRIEGAAIVVGLDPSRGLAVVDPDDREATISVGAALFTLRLALMHFGFGAHVALWPDPLDPEACARLDVTDEGSPPDPDLEPLFEAITQRHTSHARFTEAALPQLLLDAMVKDAQSEGADLVLLSDYPSRHAVAEVVSLADRTQMADKRFRRELAMWLRSPRSHRPDGMRGYGSDLTHVMSVAAPLVVRTFDVGEGRAARDVELATGSPVLGVLTTTLDDRTSWLQAGQALARVALRATAANVQLGFLDQPLEVPALRVAAADAFGASGSPQLLLRFGYGSPPFPQPRRSLDDALTSR